MVCLGGVVRMLSALRRGRVTEEQDVLSPAPCAAPDPAALLLATQLGRLPAARVRQLGGLACAALLPAELPTLPLSALPTHRPQCGTAAVPEHELRRGSRRWRRRSSSAWSADSIAAVPAAGIPLSQSRAGARPSPSLQLVVARLQPAHAHNPTAYQPPGREGRRGRVQEVGLHQSGGFIFQEVSGKRKLFPDFFLFGPVCLSDL